MDLFSLGGMPDELPAEYGSPGTQPATVHQNMDTARPSAMTAAQAAASTDGRGTLAPSYSAPLRQGVPGISGPPPFSAAGPSLQVRLPQLPSPQPPPPVFRPAESLAGPKIAPKVNEKTAKQTARASEKQKLTAWKQAAQYGLRYDATRGKWYRDVKINSVIVGTAPSAGGASSDRPLLVQGATGADVRRAQKLLAEKGFACGADGKFTASMKKQVIAFQTSTGLEPDGKIGRLTWEELDPSMFDLQGTAGSTGTQTVRQYQDNAVAIMKGPLPAGGAEGVVLSPNRFASTIAALQAELADSVGPFPLPDLTPPPKNWDFKQGKMKPGFNLDIAKVSGELEKVAGRFIPSGTALPTQADTSLPAPAAPAAQGPNWFLYGGIAVGALALGGMAIWALTSTPSPPARSPAPR